MKHPPHILLINPWIADFAAYNLWVRPLGLLFIGSMLRQAGFQVSLVDCLDFLSRKKTYGDGKFHKVIIEKPVPLKSVPRNYSQYGIPEEMLLKRLSSIGDKPDLIGITSGMTYWYPGVLKLIEITRKSFSKVPIILGGIYATLCYEHAKEHSGADIVFKGGNKGEILTLISDLTGFDIRTLNSELRTDDFLRSFIDRNVPRKPRPAMGGIGGVKGHNMKRNYLAGKPRPAAGELHYPEFRIPNSEFHDHPYPSFDLYPFFDYVCMTTSRGCPFRCGYCASNFLSGTFKRRAPLKVVDEIEYWTTRHRVSNIAFYDDALLVEPYENIIPILNEVIRRKIHCNFHAPNGLHVREIDEEVASLLFRGGFKTIRLGLETSNEAAQIEMGAKVDNQAFLKALENLRKAGYLPENIGVYILAGLPEQRAEEVEETIAFVRENGARPFLAEYSPTPHTPIFERAKEVSRFDLEKEPLFHNNSIFPCQWEGFTLADLRRLKEDLNKNSLHRAEV